MIDILSLVRRLFPDSEVKTVSTSADGDFSIEFSKNPVPIEVIKQKSPEYKNMLIREKAIKTLKEECSKRIRSYSGRDTSNTEWLFKSQNFQDIRATYLSEQGAINNGVNGVKLSYTKEQYDEAIRVLSRKETLRKQYQVIKKLLQSLDISELQQFDPADEKYW